MGAETDFREVYQLAGIRAWLTGKQGHWFVELGVAAQNGRIYHRARLEVLIQPRGGDGLALGRSVPLCDTEVRLVQFPETDWSWGNVTLPRGFRIEHANQCYLRVTTLEEPAI